MRKKLLLSHVEALAMFPRRVPWQSKGRIQRLKQPESAGVVMASERVRCSLIADESGE